MGRFDGSVCGCRSRPASRMCGPAWSGQLWADRLRPPLLQPVLLQLLLRQLHPPHAADQKVRPAGLRPLRRSKTVGEGGGERGRRLCYKYNKQNDQLWTLATAKLSDRGKETVCVDAAFEASVHTLKTETLTRSGAFNLNCKGAFSVMKQNFICWTDLWTVLPELLHLFSEGLRVFFFSPSGRETTPSVSAVLSWPLIKSCIFSSHRLFLWKCLIIKDNILINTLGVWNRLYRTLKCASRPLCSLFCESRFSTSKFEADAVQSWEI